MIKVILTVFSLLVLAQLPQLEPFRGNFRALTARNSSNHKGCSREWQCSANPPR